MEVTNTNDFGASGMFLAQGENRVIAGRTAENQLTYQRRSTVCLEWEGNRIRRKRQCQLPADYHSVATRMIEIDPSGAEIVVVDSHGHLQIYRVDYRNTSLVWQTPPIFGEGVAVGDLNGDNVPEIVATTGNFPPVALPGDTLAHAAAAEFYEQFVILEKTDNLYAAAWKSPPLEGKIVDLKIADVDNDDQNELIICLQNRKGSQIQLYAATR